MSEAAASDEEVVPEGGSAGVSEGPVSDQPVVVVPKRSREVLSVIDRVGWYCWRLIGVGVVAWVAIGLMGTLRIVVFPLAVSVLLTVTLLVPATWLRRHGWPPLAATWAVMLSFLAVVALAVSLIVPPVASEFKDLGPTISAAVDDVKDWVVDDSPFDVDRERLDELEDQAVSRARQLFSNADGIILDTAVLALELIAGLLLALVMTFFFVKDGTMLQDWLLRWIPRQHHVVARRAGERARRTVAGYVRGSALLGLLESSVIGITLAVTGATLVVPVMLLTFVAAFIPFVGAFAAGLLAVAVALTTAGPGAAIAVAVVALLVQQFDNDLLAPLVFGKALELHPLIILVSVAAGGALAGIPGAFVAVPLTAVFINVGDEIMNRDEKTRPAEADRTDP